MNENHIICTLIHKMVHSDPKKSLQATPRHPAKQAHVATWGHGMRGFSQDFPLWSPDSFQLVTDYPRLELIKEE